MPDVTINSSDNLTGEPQNSDVIPIIRDNATVLSQKWSDIKAALQPDPTARTAAAAAQATADAAQTAADVDADVTAHAGDPNAHHVPSTGGGGGLVEAEVSGPNQCNRAVDASGTGYGRPDTSGHHARRRVHGGSCTYSLGPHRRTEVNDLLTGATICGPGSHLQTE